MVNSRQTGDTTSDGPAPRRGVLRRILKWTGLATLSALVGLAVWVGRPWSNIDHDLRGLIDSETFTAIHVSDTAALWKPDVASVAGAVMNSKDVQAAWPAAAEASVEQVRRVREFLAALSPDRRLAGIFHGELLFLARPAPPPAPRTASLWGSDPRAPFPFERFSLVLEPSDGRAVALVKTLLGRLGLAGPLASHLPPGARLEGDALICEDVPAVLGREMFRDRIPPARLVLVCGESRIAVSTELRRARELVSTKPRPQEAPRAAVSGRLDPRTRIAIAAGLDRRTTVGTARSLSELTGWPSSGPVTFTVETKDHGVLVNARWPATDRPTTTRIVSSEAGIGLVLADAAEAAARLTNAGPRPWIALEEAAATSFTLLPDPDGAHLARGKAVPGTDASEPAYRRIRTSGAALVDWIDATAGSRLERATTPPPGRSQEEFEHIAEALAHATSESELPPREFDRLVESRHLEWAAEWERAGLASPGLALGNLLSAAFAEIGEITLDVTERDGTARFELALHPR